MEYTLTVLDTAGIQPYIFGSNKLRENIGASELVYRAARQWAFAILEKMFPGKHNIILDKQDEIDPYNSSFYINQQNGRAAEVLYVGGGKTVILFAGDDHETSSKDFVFELSKKILQSAPGLNLYAAHALYTWGQNPALPDLIEDTAKKLGQLKGKLPGSRPALGLSVTAACSSTGLPANDHDNSEDAGLSNLYSNQTIKKRQADQDATERLRRLFPQISDTLWTTNLDEISGQEADAEGDNFIAVVHADGNGLGKRIQAWNNANASSDPRKQIEKMREFSTAIAKTATEALKMAVSNFYEYLSREEKLGAKFPFRPVVFGGDDVTIVCPGEWGLALAQAYLAELEKYKLPDGFPPYGCAGVSIVKTHYPFARAYEMSEDLAKSAKMSVLQVDDKKMASAMDWHFTTTGLLGELDEIRKREYRGKEGKDGWMQARPLFLNDQYGWRNWANFQKSVIFFKERWSDSRNKTIALRGALREGRAAVQQFKTIYKHDLDALDKTLDIATAENGWAEDNGATHCVYFDAIEMMDNFSHLPSQQEDDK